MLDLTVEQVLDVARQNRGETLTSLVRGTRFTVRVIETTKGPRLAFTPESTGRERTATNQAKLEAIVSAFNLKRTLTTSDYAAFKSQNLTYILKLIALAAVQQSGDPTRHWCGLTSEQVYLRRATFFYNLFQVGGNDIEHKTYLLSAALFACDSLLESLEGLSERGMLPGAQDQLQNMKRAHLIRLVRNQDAHGNPLPIPDARFRWSFMITGSRRPLQLEVSGGAGIAMSMHGGKPTVQKKNVPGGTSKVRYGTSVHYTLDGSQILVCDMTAGKEVVPLATAIRELIEGLALIVQGLGERHT